MTTKELPVGRGGRISAQAASGIVRIATKYGASVLINIGSKTVNAKSVMGMVSLGEISSTVRLTADGKDEDAAIAAIAEAISDALGI